MARARGGDVSFWQDNNSTPQQVNFKKAYAAGWRFVGIKASQFRLDEDFIYNWKAAKDEGLLRMAYHFLDPRWSEIEQAKLFVNVIGNDPGELPPICDYEWNDPAAGPKYLPQADVWRGRLWNFMTHVERELGIVPGIYTGYYYWAQYGSTDPAWARYPLWLAWWAAESIVRVPKPWTKWTFWQDTAKGDGPKYGCESMSVDMDWFNGTEDELRKFARVSTPIPPITLCPTCGQPWKG